MTSEQFQSAHEDICDIGTRLLQYLQETRAGRLSEGDDTKGLQSVEDDITKSLTALKEKKYQVAVIAAMKAGKSTFLNVLIGEDILASESEACTVCRTDIRPINNGSTPRLLEYREGQREPVIVAEGEVEEIRRQFLKRTHEIRATKNSDKATRFELQHHIEAISELPSLTGFTLVDTPGPNEWESVEFSTVELKKTALEVLRTCDAILFILDYSSFKDNTNSELLQELMEQRKEALQSNTGKLYFILNKVDRKSEKDRAIEDVIKDLRQALIGFGIHEPTIYPVSAWQGLLAKLIQKRTASKEHKTDFKKFFLARYMEEDEEGEIFVPKMADAAPKALADSNIPTIENSVIQTVIQNSGWNLLSDALSKFDKSAKAIEDMLNTRISGWEMELETLKQKVEEYKKHAQVAREKVKSVKESIEQKKKILIEGFSQGILRFADSAKDKIEEEISQVAESFSSSKPMPTSLATKEVNILYKEVNLRFKIPEWLPFIGGASFAFETKTPLLEALKRAVPTYFNDKSSDEYKSSDFNKIRVKTKQEGEKIVKTINDFCSPHIQNWWIVTQDKLINDGTKIREELVEEIKNDIQTISNELSAYLGEALQVDLNVNPIQFPNFDFPGIDIQIKDRQESFKQKKKNSKYTGEKSEGFCESEEEYNARKSEYIFEDKSRSVYEVDLIQTCEEIKLKIDNQSSGTQIVLQQIIEKQIKEDFNNAERQINAYIDRFQNIFDSLIKERKTKEGEREKICAALEEQKDKLSQYLNELSLLRLSLDKWQPVENKIQVLVSNNSAKRN